MRPACIRILQKPQLTLEELDQVPVYQCQCCKPAKRFHFKAKDGDICPLHGYPLHYAGLLGHIYPLLSDTPPNHQPPC